MMGHNGPTKSLHSVTSVALGIDAISSSDGIKSIHKFGNAQSTINESTNGKQPGGKISAIHSGTNDDDCPSTVVIPTIMITLRRSNPTVAAMLFIIIINFIINRFCLFVY